MVSLVVDGQPSPLLLIYLGIEIVAGLLGLAVLAAAVSTTMPAGGAMIATLLTTVLLTVASGLVTYYVPALEEASGEVHEVLATLTLVLVIVHVIGVSVASYLQGENLIGGMISGWKREPVEPKTALDTGTATEPNHTAASR